jgi:glycerol-3-phosphate dehydrogenase (NAD(P)+)
MAAVTGHITVLGAGSWGTALAALLAANGHVVRLWAREERLVAALRSELENARYLPGIPLSPRIHPTSDRAEAVAQATVVVFAVPSGALRQVAEEFAPYLASDVLLLSASKGLEDRTGLRMSEVLAATLPNSAARTVVLSGPNLAVEMARGVPTASVAASADPEAASTIQRLFTHQSPPTFRVYTSGDVIGVELGGAIKNVIAICAGVCDGLGFGDNAKAALMTRGLSEAVRLGRAQGADEATFMGLSGVGDLIATGASALSRNYRVGKALGQGRSLFDTLAELGQVAEGVPTTRALCDLAARSGVEMPLCSALNAVLFDNRSATEMIHALMLRPPKPERGSS